MVYGICKLTGNSGEFVESHLIPKALTRPTIAGDRFISGGQGNLPKKSWSSWYDANLVIKKGELILAEYDNWAIRELRRLQLVWSGWRNKTSMPVETWFGSEAEGFGLREVQCTNPSKLRLFFLSLLWRAAATSRPEFSDVNLAPGELEVLRTMVRDGNPRPLDFYPTTLLQIVTRGESHNLGPFVQNFSSDMEPLLQKAEDESASIPKILAFRTYRFYFDGLIAHMHFDIHEKLQYERLGPLFVGFGPILRVQTQTWEHSFQLYNMVRHLQESAAWWPQQIGRLTGTPQEDLRRLVTTPHREIIRARFTK